MFVYLIVWEEKKMLNFNFLNNLSHWGDALAKVEHEMKHKHDDFRQALNPNTMEAAIWLVEELKNSLDDYMKDEQFSILVLNSWLGVPLVPLLCENISVGELHLVDIDEEALELSNDNVCNLIDLREEGELHNSGSIENATHIPRGLLEFSLNENSPIIQNKIVDIDKEIVLFCAAGGRSALAAKTLKDMGFKNVSHIEGGFGAMQQKGFKIKK